MNLKNKEIYEYNQKLAIFSKCNLTLPVRVSFYLQKNIQLIKQAVQDIDRTRLGIGEKFGTRKEDRSGYDIPQENMAKANQELNELFELEQDLNIHIFKLEDFNSINLSYQEMSAIMFMIEE